VACGQGAAGLTACTEAAPAHQLLQEGIVDQTGRKVWHEDISLSDGSYLGSLIGCRRHSKVSPDTTEVFVQKDPLL